jgi:hypothetical protein
VDGEDTKNDAKGGGAMDWKTSFGTRALCRAAYGTCGGGGRNVPAEVSCLRCDMLFVVLRLTSGLCFVTRCA